MIKRILPPRIEAWEKKKNKRVAKRKMLKDKTMEDWVNVNS